MGNINDFYDEVIDIDYESFEDEEVVNSGSNTKISSNDAYIYSMRNKGRVDLSYMSQISGIPVERLTKELRGRAIWPDPEKYDETKDYYGCFTSKQQYLRGNLVRKHINVQRINKRYGLFDDTLKLIEESLPEQIDPGDIHMNLASTWIPTIYVIEFVYKLLDMLVPPRIEYNEHLGKWNISVITDPNYVKNSYTYGTVRMNAINIIKHILNARPVKVYDQVPKTDGDGFDSILNKEESLAAQQKEKAIQDAWQDFVHGNTRIEKHLQEAYSEYYGYSLTRYDGEFLDLPNLNPEVTPYPHQKDAIARIVLNHNTLLAHEVGAGKTLEYICGVHELIRMNLGKKAMIVLPNNTFDSVVKTYRNLYKEDEILAVYPKKDFIPAKRKETIDKIKSDKYQVIIMAYSSFDMITLSQEYAIKRKEKELRECRIQLDNSKSYLTKKALKNRITKLRKDLKEYRENYKIGETTCFDKLGIDILVVDESHNYKNISLDNRANCIVGVHTAGSRKADHMLEKVEYIQSIDGHVIFATGTPITNSLADLFVIQRYLQPEELRLCKIFHFNSWISTFCEQTHSFEIDVDSKNYRFITRFSKFHNLPELMSMFSGVCDFYQIANGDLGLPDFKGYTDTLVKKSIAQKDYIDNIATRTDDIRARRVKRTEDNLLKITVDGRKCALDIRLVVPESQTRQEENKVSVCAGKMADIYFNNPNTTQIAFSDISTPKYTFNIYDELKSELIKRGIPSDQIMYIHDAETEGQRNRLEKRFNAGEIRILIGSTMKLGTGCNVQERLIAIHHLDVPWRPADMVQREGRIIRQGNTNRQVYVYRYVTEASFDSYTWQILENKQRFIAQFLSGSLSSVHREETDCSDTVLDYAEIKALAIGNPLIKERVEVANELEHVKINQRKKRKELANLKELLDMMPGKIRQRKLLISNTKSDKEYYAQVKQHIPMVERRMFGEELLYAIKRNIMVDKERVFETYQGFNVVLPENMPPDRPYVLLRRPEPDSNSYSVKVDGDKPLGVGKRLDYVLDHLSETVAFHEVALNNLYKQKEEASKTIEEGNGFDILARKLSERLIEIDNNLKEGKTL